MPRPRFSVLAVLAALVACSSSPASAPSGGTGSGGAGGAGGGAAAPATTVAFDLSGSYGKDFYAFPYPSDLRVTQSGAPDFAGFPNPDQEPAVDQVLSIASDRLGFPVIPVAFFHFDGAIAARDAETVIDADASSPILLVDVDPKSPDRGALTPTVATTPPVDSYVPSHLLAVAPRPGFVLSPKRTYAFVVRKQLEDKAGRALGVPSALATLAAGGTPPGTLGAKAKSLYAPLWSALEKAGVPASDVAAATVFTTGDVVEDTAALGEQVLADYDLTIDGLHFIPTTNNGARYCELVGTITYPQFQQGTPPFDTQGTFAFDAQGKLVKQRDEVAPLTITLPAGAMPATGYPLAVYFHGSGGVSTELVDRGAVTTPGGMATPGQGPAYVLAPFGIAMAGSALPLNPERFPGASETEYLNLGNLAAFRDTFRQGVLEQRLFLKALAKLTITPEEIGACAGVSLPPGATASQFDDGKLLAQGQSMGAMYTNMVASTEPRYIAALPTGAGGFWTFFILKTQLIANAATLVGRFLLGTDATLTFMHPALAVTETAWEPSDPFVYMPRVAKDPLPGAPVRPIYEPVGLGDSYFPTELYDAVALSYGHREAGDVIWKSMQVALAEDHLDGIVSYPVSEDVTSLGGTKYTGVIVQYRGDGIYDPHSIFSQLDSVKYQYGCFFDSFLRTGVAVVPPVQPLGTPCPTAEPTP